jgi:hypothetical protein
MIAAPFFILPSFFGVTFRVPKIETETVALSSALFSFEQVVQNAGLRLLLLTNIESAIPRHLYSPPLTSPSRPLQ